MILYTDQSEREKMFLLLKPFRITNDFVCTQADMRKNLDKQ